MAALKGSSSTGGPSPCGPSDISRPSGTSALSKAGSIQGSSESGNIGGLSGPGPTEEEFSKQAFPDLIPDMTLNLGMSSSTLRVLPFLNPGASPSYLPRNRFRFRPRIDLGRQSRRPFCAVAFAHNIPVTGAAGHGPSNAEPGVFIFQVGPSNAEPGVFIFQVGPEAELVASAKQPAFQMQGRPNWGAAGSLPGGPRYPAPLISASSVKKTVVPTTASRVTQAVQGGFGPQGPPSVTQGQPIILPFNGGPQTMWVTGDNGVAPVQSRGPREKVGGSQSVYANFRLWQRYKPLAGLYFTQAPDTEAFACFLIPVLRSLARLKPTMTVEEGLGKAMQEWQHISKSEQEIYYGMATKFMEFETEEQMQAPKLQCGKGEKVLQSSTLPKPELQGTPPPAVGQQSGAFGLQNLPSPGAQLLLVTCVSLSFTLSVSYMLHLIEDRSPVDTLSPPHTEGLLNSTPACVTGNASPRALAPLPTKPKDQSLPRTQAPSEIPAEAVEEYIEIMNDLLKDHKIEESRKDLEEEEDRTWLILNLFPSAQVEAIIDDRFLGHLLSSEPQLDISTLAKELEEVEGFSRSQLTDENLQALLDEQTGKAHLCHQKTHQDSIPEGISANIGAPTPTQASRPRASAATSTCVPTSSSGQTPRPVIQLATEASEPKPSQCPHPVLTTLGSRADHILEKDPLGILMPGPNESSEEEDLPSLAFLLDPCQSRQPRGLPLRPAPAPGPPEA
ncbi:NUT family member 2G-like [Suncus etruscus]|uniref:NUT family member 2G-like n=1 Tax=Suncus etruscus TaxID=109475 RepID=UPI002110D27C|nr:NUT family member 2G-like [Suncus etruscus]